MKNPFSIYKRLELKVCTWDEADKLIKEAGIQEDQKWHIADEDKNYNYPLVCIERRVIRPFYKMLLSKN